MYVTLVFYVYVSRFLVMILNRLANVIVDLFLFQIKRRFPFNFWLLSVKMLNFEKSVQRRFNIYTLIKIQMPTILNFLYS